MLTKFGALTSIASLLTIVSFTNASAGVHTALSSANSFEKTNLTKIHYRDYDHSHSIKSLDQIRLKLEKRGYGKFQILDRRSPIYVLKACRDGIRYKFAIKHTGRIRYKKQVGYCSRSGYKKAEREYGRRDYERRGYERRRHYNDGISPSQIIRKLARHGYGRVYFTDRVPPVYTLSACRGGLRYKVYVNVDGYIERNQRIGYCSTGSRYRDFWRSPRRFR